MICKKILGPIQLVLALFTVSTGLSQFGNYTMTGPTIVYEGKTYQYNISNGYSISSTTWGINNTYGSVMTSTVNTATINFILEGATSVKAFVEDNQGNFQFVSLNITILPGLDAGAISGAQTICYSGNPSSLNNSNSASGGQSPYNYQWQYSNNGSNGWNNISGATTSSYDPPGNQTSTKWYRRKVTASGDVDYSNTVKVTVRPNLTAGFINGTQTICYGEDPSIFGNVSSASGGNGSYSYQWQYSTNGSSGWTNISGATGASFDSSTGLTATFRWFRRRVQSCSQTKYSNTVKVTVQSDLSAGSINGTQTICYSGNPSALGNSSSASGGDGNYAYQWQYSNNGSSGWTNIAGATATAYNPPSGLTSDRWYRRRVQGCSQTKYTGSVKITVRPSLIAGSINGADTICYSGDPSALGNSSSASGGDGNYAYQWQYSNNGSSGWTNIAGATATAYNPPSGLTSDRWYRRRVQGCSQTKYTGSVKITVRPSLIAGSINGADTICYSGDPSALGNSSSASGGDGNYAYQWQYSNNGSSGWTNIAGATATAYNPPSGLTSDRWYRRRVQGCSQTKYTGSVKITVRPSLIAGSIDGADTICYSGNPSALGNNSSASGGDGNYAYQWQYSNNGSSGWTDIGGATLSTYNPPGGLTADRWYRRGVTSCGQTKHTVAVKVTVTEPPIWYADPDGDGFGDPSDTTASCDQPLGYVANDNDACPGEYGTNNGCDYTAVVLSDENHIYTKIYQRAMGNASGILSNRDIQESVTYYDGLGRPIQNVSIKASPDTKDIVTYIGYDTFGRQVKDYLPYEEMVGNVGSYRANAQTVTETFYDVAKYDNTLNPYSERYYEASPLNRVLKQGAPGNDWAISAQGDDHTIGFGYHANSNSDGVKHYRVSIIVDGHTYLPSLVLDDQNGGVYGDGQLFKTITQDENHDGTSTKLHTVEEFTDKQGRVVLKRTYALIDNVEEPHDTYYVYDDYGNLTYVLPPKVDTSDGVAQVELDELCYQYVHDHRNRLVEKKVPGKGWEHIVYDKLDRPIMTRDALLEGQGKWLFTRYDAHGRVAFTGMVAGGSRQTEQAATDNASVQWSEQSGTPTVVDGLSLYYDANGYPALGSVTELHTIKYYDGYNSTRDGIARPVGQVLGQDQATNVTGLPTATKVRVLDNSEWISTLMVYDQKGRAIWTKSENPYLGTTDIVETELDFVGRALEQQTEHTKSGNPTITTTDKFEYDHMGRLILQEQTLGGNTETLFLNEYDALGQLVTKDVGNGIGNPLQTVDFAYNVRGWLTDINDVDNKGNDIFAFQLQYNQPSHATSVPLYNGNISQANWSTANTVAAKFRYIYNYDALNRITNARFTAGGYWDRYNLENVTYDKNGNIKGLERRGHIDVNATTFGAMDNLMYTYDSGNKLIKVADNAHGNFGFTDGIDSPIEYDYDANGNMTSDLNKGISSVEYNHLNMPTNIVTGTGNISYVYDAMGTKMEKSSGGSVTQYAGNYIYSGVSGNETLQFIGQPEGYVTPDGMGGYDYVYQYKDHLGNVRLSYVNQSIDDQFYFETGTGGWSPSGTTILNNANQKLNISITDRWNSASKYYNITPGVPLHIEFDFEKGDMITPTFLVREQINGVWEASADRDKIIGMVDGHYELDLTLTGDYIRVYFEKSTASDDGTTTTCYVDNFKIYQKDIELVEENNYYPFGLKHKGYNGSTSSLGNDVAQKWKYNGKELQEELGLDWYDYGWRNYDPAIGRWMNIDILAGSMKQYSPYNYALNNPIYFIDINGLSPGGQNGGWFDYYKDPDGKVIYDPSVNGPDDVCADCEYIGRTYFDKNTATYWDEDGKSYQLPVVLNGVTVTGTDMSGGDSGTSSDSAPTSWGVGTEDRGRKGNRKGELNYNDLPGTGSARGGGNPWKRFIEWLSGTFTRATEVQKVVASPEANTSTMETQPASEPTVVDPYAYHLLLYSMGDSEKLFGQGHRYFVPRHGVQDARSNAVNDADSLLSTNGNLDSIVVQPFIIRKRGQNNVSSVRDTTINRN